MTRKELLMQWKEKQMSSGGVRLDEDEWITVNGTHVLIDDDGTAKSGGTLKGKNFSGAKSQKSTSKKSTGSSATESSGEKKGGSGKKSAPTIRDNPASPAKVNAKKCNKARDAGLSKSGGTVHQSHGNGTETWEFNGKVSKTAVAAQLADSLREAGFQTSFITDGGKETSKNTGNVIVTDPKNWYRTITYSVLKSDESGSGKTYFDIMTEDAY